MLAAFDLSFPSIAVIPLIFAGIGSYLGSYLKKKGENLATHEDLDKLVKQVAAVTQTTKSIEAAISDDVWNKQKRWELKREVLFEAAKRLSEVNDALLSLVSVYKLAQSGETDFDEEYGKSQVRWTNAAAKLDETNLLIEIIGEKETIAAFMNYRAKAYEIVVKLIEKDNEVYAKSQEIYIRNLIAARASIRAEFGMDSSVSIQSNESTAKINPYPQSLELN